MARHFVASSSQYLTRDCAPVSAYPLTVAGWFRVADNNPPAQEYLFFYGKAADTAAQINIFADLNGTLVAWDRGAVAEPYTSNAAITSADYCDQAWHSLVATFSVSGGSVTQTLYVDGVLAASKTISGTVKIGTYDRVALGMQRDASPAAPLSGDLARWSMTARVWSAPEIAAFAASGATPADVAALWELAGSAEPEPDSAPAHNDLTVVGATAGNGPFLGIASPVPYRTYQRRNGAADIPISGSYVGSPTAIEARWNGGAWTTIVASPEGGSYSGTLSAQPQGQGTLEVRFANDARAAATVAYVGIGEILIIGGQSNASGRGTTPTGYSHPTLKATCFGNDYKWKDLPQVVDSATGQVDAVSAGDVAAGSVWPEVATAMMARLGVPVCFVPCPKGGTQIAQWQPGADHSDRTTLYGSMNYRISQCGDVRLVLWWQGESDAQYAVSQATYRAGMASLAAAVAADHAGLKLMPCTLQSCSGTIQANIDAINAAIAQEWSGDPNVLRGPDLTALSSDDAWHLQTAAKITAAAAAWGTAILAEVDQRSPGNGWTGSGDWLNDW